MEGRKSRLVCIIGVLHQKAWGNPLTQRRLSEPLHHFAVWSIQLANLLLLALRNPFLDEESEEVQQLGDGGCPNKKGDLKDLVPINRGQSWISSRNGN